MNLQAPGTTDMAGADIVFFKRQRIVRGLFAFWLLVGLCRIPPIAARWPAVAEAALWLVALVSLVGVPLLIWAARCPICGGGIKLNGRTCSRCGHVFTRPKA